MIRFEPMARKGMIMTRRNGSARVADALRASPPSMDELRRARIERRLLELVHGERGEPGSRAGAVRKHERRGVFVGPMAGAMAMAALALLVWVSLDVAEPLARVERSGTSGSEGTMRVGATLEVSEAEHAVVEAFGVRIEVSGAATAMRFAALEREHVELQLERGSIDVAFHPSERGRERLSIETPSARVEVVGTEFTVRISGEETLVVVREGVVRVVPRARQEEAVLVHAGGQVAVALEDEPRFEPVAEAPESRAEVEPPANVEIEAPIEAAASQDEPAAPRVERAAGLTRLERMTPAVDRLSAAGQVLERGEHERARAMLAAVAHAADASLDVKITAETLMGDSFQASGLAEQAAAAYERAASLGQGRDLGHLAIIALARLHERVRLDPDEARRTYVRYLEEAPNGANARMAREAICRLGGDARAPCGGPATR